MNLLQFLLDVVGICSIRPWNPFLTSRPRPATAPDAFLPLSSSSLISALHWSRSLSAAAPAATQRDPAGIVQGAENPLLTFRSGSAENWRRLSSVRSDSIFFLENCSLTMAGGNLLVAGPSFHKRRSGQVFFFLIFFFKFCYLHKVSFILKFLSKKAL